ncbi:MAG: hypothetical protein WC310_01280 [Patescibacteria group bacterium]|jgi:hypothetical protein
MNKKVKVGILIGFVIAIALVMIVCCLPRSSSGKNQDQINEGVEVAPGLWLIKAGACINKDAWKKSLPNFIQKHPDLQIVSIYPAVASQCGDEETFLVTIPKSICPIKL